MDGSPLPNQTEKGNNDLVYTARMRSLCMEFLTNAFYVVCILLGKSLKLSRLP